MSIQVIGFCALLAIAAWGVDKTAHAVKRGAIAGTHAIGRVLHHHRKNAAAK